LPKWFTARHPTRSDWIANASVAPPEMVAQVMNQLVPNLTVNRIGGEARPELVTHAGERMRAGPIEELQTIKGENLHPLVTDSAGNIIRGQVLPVGNMPLQVYVLSDPDFLNTHGVANLDTARAGLAMFDIVRGDHEFVIFDVTMNGLGGAKSPLKIAF